MKFQIPDYIQSLQPYVPGKPIEETQRELGIDQVVKLASNENPLGPSPKAVAVAQDLLSEQHRYPDGSAYRLKNKLSEHLDVPTDYLITGNGSNEVIDMIVRTFCRAGDAIVTSEAAFIAYRICAQIHGVETLEAPLQPDLRFDLKKMAQLVRDYPSVRCVFIPNPNNPTGTYVTTEELEAFLDEVTQIPDRPVLVVLDYAYWEYVTAKDLPDPSIIGPKYPNLLILRTFSKVYGLAGMRIGYGVSSPAVIDLLNRVRQPFNINALALASAEAALDDTEFVARSKETNEQQRAYWEKELTQMGIPFWPSQGNFILADVSEGLGKRGGDVYLSCLKRGVIFRPVANYGLTNALRISIGTPEENKIAVQALRAELPSSYSSEGRPS